jgi:hypothetical protein
MRIRIRDPAQSRSGSGMNIPDHISVSLETIFGFKILKLFDVDPNRGSGIFLTLDPGSGMEKIGSGIRDKLPGSATLLKRIVKISDTCFIEANIVNMNNKNLKAISAQTESTYLTLLDLKKIFFS